MQFASAAVTTITSRTAWNSAVGGAPDTLEDFDRTQADVEFDTGTNPYALTGFSLGTSSHDNTFGNFVDFDLAPGPFPQNPVNGGADAPYASLFVDGDALDSGGGPGVHEEVELVFDAPVFAWGAAFNLNEFGVETVNIELRRADNGLESTLTLAADGFLGFTSSPNKIAKLVFKGAPNGLAGGTTFGMDDVVTKTDAPVSNTAPGAALTAPDVLLSNTGETSYSLTVTYTDDSAVDISTIGTADLTVTGPGGALTIVNGNVDIGSDGTPRIATYALTPPGGSWDLSDNGTYTVGMNANEVGDDGGTQLFVPAGTLGTFEVRASSGFASSFTTRSSWESAIGGPGAVDFSENFEGFATQADWSASPVVSPPGAGGNFSLIRVGGSSDFSNFVDINAGSQAGDVSGVAINYAAVFVEGDAGLTVEMTFDTAVAAWCVEFFSHDSDEDIELDLFDAADTLLDSLAIPADGIFGFTTSSPGTVKKIVFQAASPDGTGGGELFGLDNLFAATAYTANTDPIVSNVSAADVTPSQTGQTAYSFDLTFSDNAAVDVSSIDVNNVTVTGPGGTLTVISAIESSGVNGTGVT